MAARPLITEKALVPSAVSPAGCVGPADLLFGRRAIGDHGALASPRPFAIALAVAQHRVASSNSCFVALNDHSVAFNLKDSRLERTRISQE
jgi:hypothetical protein